MSHHVTEAMHANIPPSLMPLSSQHVNRILGHVDLTRNIHIGIRDEVPLIFRHVLSM